MDTEDFYPREQEPQGPSGKAADLYTRLEEAFISRIQGRDRIFGPGTGDASGNINDRLIPVMHIDGVDHVRFTRQRNPDTASTTYGITLIQNERETHITLAGTSRPEDAAQKYGYGAITDPEGRTWTDDAPETETGTTDPSALPDDEAVALIDRSVAAFRAISSTQF